MFDEQERLHDCGELSALLCHYAHLGLEDRELWHDRVMALEGMAPRDLVKLHGELIAYGWLEQNTGQTPNHKAGIAAACYRLTREGRRAIKQLPAEIKVEPLPMATVEPEPAETEPAEA